MTPVITLDVWRATRRYVPCFAADAKLDFFGFDDNVKGYVYEIDDTITYIFDVGDGKYELELCGSTEVSADLAKLEAELYDFIAGESKWLTRDEDVIVKSAGGYLLLMQNRSQYGPFETIEDAEAYATDVFMGADAYMIVRVEKSYSPKAGAR
jgi:hypothetical protein